MDIIQIMQDIPGFLHGKGANEQDIAIAEQELGLKFAPEYKEYLLYFGIAAFRGHELTGLSGAERTNVVGVTNAQRKLQPSIPADLYVIEEANIDGIALWQNGEGMVYTSSPNGNTQYLCDSIASLILT